MTNYKHALNTIMSKNLDKNNPGIGQCESMRLSLMSMMAYWCVQQEFSFHLFFNRVLHFICHKQWLILRVSISLDQNLNNYVPVKWRQYKLYISYNFHITLLMIILFVLYIVFLNPDRFMSRLNHMYSDPATVHIEASKFTKYITEKLQDTSRSGQRLSNTI